MRVALLVCGQPRTMEFCYPSLKQHIIDVYRPDVFVCTDSQLGRVIELYKPQALEVIDQEMLYDLALEKRRAIPSVLPVNDLSIAWKVNTAMQLKAREEKYNDFIYDVVILTRFDVKFKAIPPITAEPNTFHVPLTGGYWTTPPDSPGIHWGGYSSHLCWGTSKIMNGIANIYFDEKDYLTLAVNSGVPFGWAPEHVLKYYCDVNQIEVCMEDINMMLIRGTNKNPLAFDNSRLEKYPEYA